MNTPPFQSARSLVGVNGNVFAVIGTVSRGLREAGAPRDVIDQFTAEATASRSYDEALQVCMRWTVGDGAGAEATDDDGG